MAKTSTRNIKLVGFAGLGVIAVGGIVLGIVPLVGQLGGTNEDIDAANQQTSQLRTQIQQLEGVQDNEAEVNKFKEDFVAAFPETAQVPDLINTIATAAVQAGIPASSITNYGFQAPVIGAAATATSGSATTSGAAGTPAAAAPAATAPTTGTGAAGTGAAGTTGGSALGATTGQAAAMTLNLTVQGNTRKFATFMTNLTNMDRNFSITTFAVAGGAQGTPDTLTLTGRTLLYSHITTPEESASGAGATGVTGTGAAGTGATVAPVPTTAPSAG